MACVPCPAQNTKINPDAYLHKVLFLGDGSNCPGPAVALGMQSCATTGGCTVWMQGKNKMPQIVAHELGHNIGLFHGVVVGEWGGEGERLRGSW